MSAWEGLSPPYSTIVADPPWRMTGSGSAYGNITRPPYSDMSLREISDMPVRSAAAADAWVFMWVTNLYLRDGWGVLESWGFTPLGRTLVWCKQPRGVMPVTTEFILIGKVGSPRRLPWSGTTWWDWPRPTGHSAKPPQFLDLVESWCGGPYLELFARAPRLGWDSWGYGYEGQAA